MSFEVITNDSIDSHFALFTKSVGIPFLEKNRYFCSGDEAENAKKEEFFSSVRPEEIPDVPSNKFLSRDPPPPKDKDKQEPR